MIARLLALAVLAGSALSTEGAAAGRHHIVVIDGMKFGAVPSGVRVGDTIEWVNRDIFRHTATARDGSFNVDLPAGAKAAVTVKRAGAVAFFCRYHPGMTGTLIVAR